MQALVADAAVGVGGVAVGVADAAVGVGGFAVVVVVYLFAALYPAFIFLCRH